MQIIRCVINDLCCIFKFKFCAVRYDIQLRSVFLVPMNDD